MSTTAVSQSIRDVWTKVHSPEGFYFPKAVEALLALGVTRYHVDYVASTTTAYIPNAQTGGVDIDVASIPSHVAGSNPGAAWNAEGVRAAIRRTQAGETKFPQFSREVFEAGVTNYFAYLDGKRVVYLGSLGDVHVEWFPGAKPEEKN